jgi:23S rRNA (adenine-N6)-dimethyltransferase
MPRRAEMRSRKTLSQNFLSNPRDARRVVDVANLTSSDLVLEIGAGAGALTSLIAPRAARVMAYEIDPKLSPVLQKVLGKSANVEILYADILQAKAPSERFKLISNVPFGSTSAVVRWILAAPSLDTATLVTQLEYAKKRTGEFGRWSMLTISTWPEFEWSFHGRIPRASFHPAPGVDAGLLHIEKRPAALVDKRMSSQWERFVEIGFGGVGGSLFASLSRMYPSRQVAASFSRRGLDRDTVVAFVPPSDWVALFADLHRQ